MRSALLSSGLASLLLLMAWVEVSDCQEPKKSKKSGAKDATTHVFAGPAPAHPFDVILARPTDTSVDVSVVAYEPMEVFVSFGAEPGKLERTTETRTCRPREAQVFSLRHLKPDTRHYYRLHTRKEGQAEATADALQTFHTARKPGSTFVFTMQADSHLDQRTRPEIYERTLANALAAKTDFHVDLGDTFMTDKYPRHLDAAPQYYAQRYYLGQLGRSAPLFLVLGNHDGERLDAYDGSDDCMAVWSCRLRKGLFPNPQPSGFYQGNRSEKPPLGLIENYFAWEWGDALFVALDPFWSTRRRGGKSGQDGNWSRTLGKEQYDWLAKTLEGSRAKFKFVFIHHLVGGLDSSARGGSEAAVLYEWGGQGKNGKDEFAVHRPGWALPIHALLGKHQVSAVFHGHDHFYARQELDDIVYQLVPQPGHQGAEKVRYAEEYGYYRGHFLPPSGLLRVTVSPEKATVDYVRSYLTKSETATRKNGDVAFSYSIRAAK